MLKMDTGVSIRCPAIGPFFSSGGAGADNETALTLGLGLDRRSAHGHA
jgi:hypothetical protein